MIGEYSFMDLAAIGLIIGVVGSIITTIATNARDTKAILREINLLSEEHDELSNGFARSYSSLTVNENHRAEDASKERQLIKKDTTYIADELKLEKMARKELYRNTSRAKEILDTMDMMREVVNQNANLNAANAKLTAKNTTLERANQALKQQNDYSEELIAVIQSFSRRLAIVEDYPETEEIRSLLRKILNELSETM